MVLDMNETFGWLTDILGLSSRAIWMMVPGRNVR